MASLYDFASLAEKSRKQSNMPMNLYFDNAATTPMSDRAMEAYIRTEREFFANPSSVHAEGIKAKKELERIRRSFASMLGVKEECLFFTSGATESIASVFSSLLFMQPGKAIISRIEHEAVASWLPVLSYHGWKTEEVKAKGGFVRPEDLASALTPDTKLAAVMAVSNVTGAIEDIEALVKTVREYEKTSKRRIFFFSDSVQALGKIPYSLSSLDIDGASFSAHKINGPRGIGLLYLKNPSAFRPLSSAGGQERGKRGGTENLPAIAGFEAALAEWLEDADTKRHRIQGMNAMLRETIASLDLPILSPENASPYILSFASPYPSEVFVRMLSDKGISASSGSACSNNAKGESEKIMQAMGIRSDNARNAVRLSFSNDTSEEDAGYLASAIKEICNG